MRLAGLLAAALVWRSGFLWLHRRYLSPYFNLDSWEYDLLGYVFQATGHFPAFGRTIGYPWIVGLVYRFVPTPAIVQVVQVLLDTLNVGLLRAVAARVTSPRRAWAVAWVYALNPLTPLYAGWLLTEIPFMTFWMLGLFLWLEGLRRASWAWAVRAGLAFGIATHVRSIHLPVPFVWGLAWWGFHRFSRREAARVGLLGLAYGLVLVPWFLRNYGYTGQWFFSSWIPARLSYYDAVMARPGQHSVAYWWRVVREQQAGGLSPTLSYRLQTWGWVRRCGEAREGTSADAWLNAPSRFEPTVLALLERMFGPNVLDPRDAEVFQRFAVLRARWLYRDPLWGTYDHKPAGLRGLIIAVERPAYIGCLREVGWRVVRAHGPGWVGMFVWNTLATWLAPDPAYPAWLQRLPASSLIRLGGALFWYGLVGWSLRQGLRDRDALRGVLGVIAFYFCFATTPGIEFGRFRLPAVPALLLVAAGRVSTAEGEASGVILRPGPRTGPSVEASRKASPGGAPGPIGANPAGRLRPGRSAIRRRSHDSGSAIGRGCPSESEGPGGCVPEAAPAGPGTFERGLLLGGPSDYSPATPKGSASGRVPRRSGLPSRGPGNRPAASRSGYDGIQTPAGPGSRPRKTDNRPGETGRRPTARPDRPTRRTAAGRLRLRPSGPEAWTRGPLRRTGRHAAGHPAGGFLP
jgi:hypothetical protein